MSGKKTTKFQIKWNFILIFRAKRLKIDISVHRTFVMIVFTEKYAEILWVGTHDDYDSTFKGNKKTIETWLRNHGKIK